MIRKNYHDSKKDLESIFQMLTLEELRDLGRGDKNAQAMVGEGMNLDHLKENGIEGHLAPDRKNDSFRGRRMGKTLMKHATEGWKDGAEKLAQVTRNLGNVATDLGVVDTRRRSAWRDEGEELDLDRFWNGSYDDMWRTTVRDARGQTPVVTLMSSWGGHCRRKENEMFWSGAAALVAADALEEAGYSVELILCNTTRHSDEKGAWGCAAAVQVKRSDQPLNLRGLAGLACDVGVYRTFGFNMKPLAARDERVCNYNLGIPTSADTWDHEAWPVEGTPILMPDSYSLNEAIASVKKTLEGHISPQQQGA